MKRFNYNFKFIGRLLAVIAISILLYGEIFCYIIYSLQWNSLKCLSDEMSCIRILLVADPQILGENDASKIARWDSDRYLSATFHNAYFYIKPDVTVFLGDIMDEGSIATFEQYEKYLERLNDIFYLERLSNVILIPGDNDIGGESDDLITALKINRFKNELSKNQLDLLQIYNISFYCVNRLTGQYSTHINNNKIRVALSHIPLTYTPSNFVAILLDTIKPTVIFSGHTHKSFLIKNSNGHRQFINMNITNTQIQNVQFQSNELYEFVVPTCSYRMGEYNMGYGAAIIDTNRGVMSYTVLWLPPRLQIIRIYLYSAIILTILFVIYKIFSCYYNNRKIIRYHKV